MSDQDNFWDSITEEMNEPNKRGDAKEDFLESGNDEELRTIFLYLVYDVSGSMTGHEVDMYDSFVQTCRELGGTGQEDYQYRVKLILFNDDVTEFNKEFQDPAHLADLAKQSAFTCGGMTSISKVINYLDEQFTRDSMKNRGLHRSDPKSLIVIVTDYEATEAAQKVADATKQIRSNRFYEKANQTVCIYCGKDKNKSQAADLAGGLDNVATLEKGSFKDLLAPVLIQSTITLTDATHVEGTSSQPKTTGQTVQEIIEKKKEATESTKQLSSEEAKNELFGLLGLRGTPNTTA